MKTSSAKNKGRTLQNEVRDDLREWLRPYGLENEDIEGRGMGQNGVDLILTPAARRHFDADIECKNVEKLNVVSVFIEHFKKYAAKPTLKLLIHRKNRTEAMVTLRWSDFLKVLKELKVSKTPFITTKVLPCTCDGGGTICRGCKQERDEGNNK